LNTTLRYFSTNHHNFQKSAGLRLIARCSTAGFVRLIVAAVLLAFSALLPSAQTNQPPDPATLVRRAVQNEAHSSTDTSSHFYFRGTKTTPRGSVTRLYLETEEGTAGLVIAYDGKPLTPDQRRDEDARVNRFVEHPEELKKKREQEHEDADRTMRMLYAIPDAFIFESEGQEPSSDGVGRPGSTLIKLKFHPNPNYRPPSRVEEVLTGMSGIVLVDPERERLARIDGTLFRPVNFGWGIFGHLDRGGRFVVQQKEVGDHTWELTSMTLTFTGKILLFKNLSISSTETYSDFKKMPDNLTFAQALEMLKKDAESKSAPVTSQNQSRP
jgi:hypothetical protein